MLIESFVMYIRRSEPFKGTRAHSNLPISVRRDRWGGLGHLNWQRSQRVDWWIRMGSRS